jgi:hypothetical protein
VSLSSCARCWDTPCECGEAGYMLVRHEKLRLLNSKAFERIQTALQDLLNTKMADAEANEDKDYRLPADAEPKGDEQGHDGDGERGPAHGLGADSSKHDDGTAQQDKRE